MAASSAKLSQNITVQQAAVWSKGELPFVAWPVIEELLFQSLNGMEQGSKKWGRWNFQSNLQEPYSRKESSMVHKVFPTFQVVKLLLGQLLEGCKTQGNETCLLGWHGVLIILRTRARDFAPCWHGTRSKKDWVTRQWLILIVPIWSIFLHWVIPD